MLKSQDNLLKSSFDDFNNDHDISWTNSLKSALNDINTLKLNPWTNIISDQSIWANDFVEKDKKWAISNAISQAGNTIKDDENLSVDPLDEKTVIQNLINTSSNWGKTPIDQTTLWDMNGKQFDSIDRDSSKSNIWDCEPPNGTAIWDKHYANVNVGSRYRENSVETLAPKYHWNEFQDGHLVKEVTNPWNKDLQNSNISNCNQTAKQSNSATPISKLGMNKKKFNTNNNNSRPLSFNSICQQQQQSQQTTKNQSFNDISSMPNQQPTMKSPPGSLSHLAQPILNQKHANYYSNDGESLSPVLSQLPMALNNLISQPPPIQPNINYKNFNNRRNNSFNPSKNVMSMMKSLNHDSYGGRSSGVGGSSLRVDLVKQFISLGYMKEDVQVALINNNMDVERTIGELNERYPHLTHITLEHFSGQFNFNFMQHQQQNHQLNQNHQQQQQLNFFDWKSQRQMKKSNTDKDLMFHERKMMSQLTNGNDPLTNSFAKLSSANSIHGIGSKNFSSSSSSSNSSLLPDWNQLANNGSNNTLPSSNYHQIKSSITSSNTNGSGHHFSGSIQSNPMFFNNDANNGFIEDQSWPKNNNVNSSKYDKILTDLQNKYEMIKERMSNCLSQKKNLSGNNCPTNLNSMIHELKSKLIQLEYQYATRYFQLSFIANNPTNNSYLGDDGQFDEGFGNSMKFDSNTMQHQLNSNNPQPSAPQRMINKSFLQKSNRMTPNGGGGVGTMPNSVGSHMNFNTNSSGNNWSNNFPIDNRMSSFQENQFSFNNKPVRNIKINSESYFPF